jgi:hypothetical protein
MLARSAQNACIMTSVGRRGTERASNSKAGVGHQSPPIFLSFVCLGSKCMTTVAWQWRHRVLRAIFPLQPLGLMRQYTEVAVVQQDSNSCPRMRCVLLQQDSDQERPFSQRSIKPLPHPRRMRMRLE